MPGKATIFGSSKNWCGAKSRPSSFASLLKITNSLSLFQMVDKIFTPIFGRAEMKDMTPQERAEYLNRDGYS